jgi:hypothetical protein
LQKRRGQSLSLAYFGLELFLGVGIGFGLLVVACMGVVDARCHERLEAM